MRAEHARQLAGESPFDNLLHSFAVLYGEEGWDAEAVPRYERALAIDERVLDPGHSRVAGDLRDLAVALRDLRRNAEADACEQRAATIRSQTAKGNLPRQNRITNSLQLARRERFFEREPLSVIKK